MLNSTLFQSFIEELHKHENKERESIENIDRLSELLDIKDISQIQIASDKKDNELITVEKRLTGRVKWEVNKYYFQTAGGLLITIIIILLYFISYGIDVGDNFVLSEWSSSMENNHSQSESNNYLLWYFLLSVFYGIISMISMFLLDLCCARADKVLHEQLTNNILHLPMSFFDTTPMGRIVNRFSKDMYIIIYN